jgi:hypothetical protein
MGENNKGPIPSTGQESATEFKPPALDGSKQEEWKVRGKYSHPTTYNARGSEALNSSTPKCSMINLFISVGVSLTSLGSA